MHLGFQVRDAEEIVEVVESAQQFLLAHVLLEQLVEAEVDSMRCLVRQVWGFHPKWACQRYGTSW